MQFRLNGEPYSGQCPKLGISLFAVTIRAVLPEHKFFLKQKAREHGKTSRIEKMKISIKQFGKMVKTHWLLCIYGLLFMTDTLSPF